DDAAGKRVKCPGCGEVSTVPTKRAATKAPATVETISFECDCGHTVRVKAEHVGRKVRCPGREAVITVPALEDEEQDGAARIQPVPARGKRAPARQARHEEEEDEEAIQTRPAPRRAAVGARHRRDEEDERAQDEEEERPHRRQMEPESSILPWVLIGS